jgi:hypothetical protein
VATTRRSLTPGQIVAWSLGILLFFVVITVGELVLLRHIGVDVLGHLQVTLAEGKTTQFMFETFGATAFVFVQPLLLLTLFIKLSNQIRAIGGSLLESVSQLL